MTFRETTVLEHPAPSLSLPGDRPERAEVLRGLKDLLEREKALTYKLHRDGAPGDIDVGGGIVTAARGASVGLAARPRRDPSG